jgi:hypothetical protein
MSSQFQDLTQQFNTLLNEYTETYDNYINTLKAKDNTFIQIPNYSYIGESNLSVLNNTTIDACQSACTLNTDCTGATFNTSLNNCTLASGSGQLIYNTTGIAIAKKLLYYTTYLKDLNQQMINLNEQMINLSKNNYDQSNQNQTQIQQQEQIVKNNYNVLLDERKIIEKLGRQYQTIDAAYKDVNVVVNENYAKYIVFLLIAILLILYSIRLIFSSTQRGGGMNSNIFKKMSKVNALFGIFCLIVLIIQIYKK